jgi:hypothetical protein
MKNLIKITVILLTSLVFVRCSEKEISINSNKEKIQEIKEKIRLDKDFNQIVSLNIKFSKTVAIKLRGKKIKSNYSSRSESYEEDLKELGLFEEFQKNMNEIENSALNIKNNYPELALLSEEELLIALEELKTKHKQKTSNYNFNKLNPCDEKFEQDFHNIHASYDKAVTWCTVLTLLSGGIASPCYGWAVSDALISLSVAMIEHAKCTENLK